MSDESANSSDEVQLVTFLVGKESFGLNIINVQEVIRMPEITRVPQAPAYVDGMTNLRGHILPVIDTRTKFGMEPVESSESSRVIVVDTGGKAVGLNVDAVSEVLRVGREKIEETPASLGENIDNSAISGVVKLDKGKKLVMILDASFLSGQDEDDEDSLTRAANDGKNIEASLDEVQIVSFLVGREEFGLEIDKVKEIIRFPEIVKVPNLPDYIKGIISLRDTLMPIVDLRTKLGTDSDEVTNTTRVVVVDIEGAFIGLTVDQVYEVIRIPRSTIFPPPEAVLSRDGKKITGIARLDDGKRIIMLIDPWNIINQKELADIDREETETGKEQEDPDMDDLDEKQLVVFKLDEEQFGVSIAQVQEITKMTNITKVPRAPKFVQGVVNLRGDVIPVIDLRQRFEMETRSYDDRTRIIVSEMRGKKVGLIVDEVLEVLRIPGKYMEEIPDIANDKQTQSSMDHIANIKDRMIMILNLEKILVADEWKRLGEMGKPAEPAPATGRKAKKQSGK